VKQHQARRRTDHDGGRDLAEQEPPLHRAGPAGEQPRGERHVDRHERRQQLLEGQQLRADTGRDDRPAEPDRTLGDERDQRDAAEEDQDHGPVLRPGGT